MHQCEHLVDKHHIMTAANPPRPQRNIATSVIGLLRLREQAYLGDDAVKG